MILMIIAAAVLFGYMLTSLYLTQTLAQAIADMHVNRWVLMVLINLFLLVCGFFIPPAAIILMTAPILLPIITAAGFDPVWFGVILTINMEIGLIHPPVGLEHLYRQLDRARRPCHARHVGHDSLRAVHDAGDRDPVHLSRDRHLAARPADGTGGRARKVMNTSFFGELLQTITERGRSLLDRAGARRESPAERSENLVELCEDLLSRRGEASGVALAREILAATQTSPSGRASPSSRRWRPASGRTRSA